MSFKTLNERVKLEVKARESKKSKSTGLDDSTLDGLCVRSKDDGKTWEVKGVFVKDDETFFKLVAPGLPDVDGHSSPSEKLTINKKELKGKYDLA